MITSKIKFTKASIDKINPIPGRQIVFWDTVVRGLGVRVSPGGSKAYIWQGRRGRDLVKVTLGRCDALTPDRARQKALQATMTAAEGVDPRATKKESGGTFGAMLSAYCDVLDGQAKVSAREVRTSLEKHIRYAHPKLWKKSAGAITLEDCLAPVASLVDEGKLRQADKLRAYIRAAFAQAVNARADASAPRALRDLRITFNPARDLRAVKGARKAKDRVLSLAEFRSYWARLKALPEPKRSLAMLHVLTGGQRQQQLQRATLNDVDWHEATLILWDSKGRRAEPRRHTVPLLPEAVPLIRNLTAGGPYIFSLDGGRNPSWVTAVSNIAKDVCAQMAGAGELEGEPFTAGAIRATIETRLAAKPYRVGSDVLAQLLSHGLGGVQNRHYQRHDFMEEKREALEMLQRMLDEVPEPSADIIPLRAAR